MWERGRGRQRNTEKHREKQSRVDKRSPIKNPNQSFTAWSIFVLYAQMSCAYS